MDISFEKIEAPALPRDSGLYDILDEKIKILHETSWRDKWQSQGDQYHLWLDNFREKERIYAMFLLSKFMYFDNETIRELMQRVYEDLYRRPIIYDIRKDKKLTRDRQIIEADFQKKLERTRFLSIGNPSESSAHLLYFFRQENSLERDLFINAHQLYTHTIEGDLIIAKTVVEGIDRIVVLDDFCGSGSQAKSFDEEFVVNLKKDKPEIMIDYFSLFAIEKGLNKIRDLHYDRADAVFVLDNTYKCFAADSRFFSSNEKDIKDNCHKICNRYGRKLEPNFPLGYKNGQMLIGFHHNTPNNSLPIFWSERKSWNPIFKRFVKIY